MNSHVENLIGCLSQKYDLQPFVFQTVSIRQWVLTNLFGRFEYGYGRFEFEYAKMAFQDIVVKVTVGFSF